MDRIRLSEGDFFETVRDAPVRIQCVGQKHECLATQRACSVHSIRHVGEENVMRFRGDGTSCAMAAEIDDLALAVTVHVERENSIRCPEARA